MPLIVITELTELAIVQCLAISGQNHENVEVYFW